jgi:hypothetical protein
MTTALREGSLTRSGSTQLERDERILAHVGLYRITFRHILEQLFFAGREAACGNVLERLKRAGRLRSVRQGGGPLKYYQLTSAEAARRGIPQRALPIGSRALPETLAVLWFCTVEPGSAHRLERDEVVRLYGLDAPHGPHCVEEGTPPRVLRLYVPGPHTKLPTIVAALDALATNASLVPGLASWVPNRLYAVAVLVSTEARETRIRRALEARRPDDVEIRVSRVPDTHSLASALHALRRG